MKLEFVELPFLQLGTNGMIRTGAGFNSGDFTTEGVPLIKIGNIKNNLIDLNDCSFISENEKKINLTKEDDLLIAMRGATSGKLGIVSKEYANCFYVGSIGNLGKINDEIIYRPFIKYIEQQLYEILKTEAKGTATPMVSIGMLAKFKLIIPKTKEQQKYLFELLENRKVQVGELSTEVSFQLSLVKKLRQQLLQDAVQGKLVEQDLNDEPASELLKRIKAEKANLIAEKKIKKEKELSPINPEEPPFDIPKNWVWCRLGEIGICQTGTTPSTVVKEYFGDDIPFIKPADITLKGLITNNEGLTNLGLKQGVLISENTVLMVCIGGSIGKSYYTEIKVSCNQQINTIKPLANIRSRFLQHFLQSAYFQKAVWAKASGGTTPIINRSKWESILIPLPPLAEQNRIVQKLDELMQYCNELEASIKQSELQNEKLLQQVLREALRKEPVE